MLLQGVKIRWRFKGEIAALPQGQAFLFLARFLKGCRLESAMVAERMPLCLADQGDVKVIVGRGRSIR